MTAMTTYEPADWRPEPGDVAMVAHVAGGSQRMSWDGKRWRSLIHGWSWLAGEASSVRRLLLVDPASTVVLDPDNPNDAQRFREAAYTYSKGGLVTAASALRSLLPVVTPPEPNGLGAVVEDARYGPIVRTHEGHWLDRSHSRVEYLPQQVEEITQHGVGCTCGAPDCNGGDQ